MYLGLSIHCLPRLSDPYRFLPYKTNFYFGAVVIIVAPRLLLGVLFLPWASCVSLLLPSDSMLTYLGKLGKLVAN